jgi:hypothetical protein
MVGQRKREGEQHWPWDSERGPALVLSGHGQQFPMSAEIKNVPFRTKARYTYRKHKPHQAQYRTRHPPNHSYRLGDPANNVRLIWCMVQYHAPRAGLTAVIGMAVPSLSELIAQSPDMSAPAIISPADGSLPF